VLFSRSTAYSAGSPIDYLPTPRFEETFNFSVILCPRRVKLLPYTHLDLFYQIMYVSRLDNVESNFQVFGTAQPDLFLSDGYLALGSSAMPQTLSLYSTQRRLSSVTNGDLELLSGMTKKTPARMRAFRPPINPPPPHPQRKFQEERL
jgi:hypothetical protein